VWDQEENERARIGTFKGRTTSQWAHNAKTMLSVGGVVARNLELSPRRTAHTSSKLRQLPLH